MTKLLIATTNQHKLREYAAIFAPLALELCTLADVGIDEDVEETGSTFAENAQLKAKFYAKRSGLLAMADDSGLEVMALDGEPGIHSRRYAGPDANDAERNQLLLKRMEHVPFHARLARFVCVIALTHPDGTTKLVEGMLPGVIEMEPRGTNGFGYDPLFYVLDEDKTLAELPPERKNAISHRARAAAAAYEVLQDWLTNNDL